MTDAEREDRAVWKLKQAGYRVTRSTIGPRAGCWIIAHGDTEAASMDNLAALVELAGAIYADHWIGHKITPSA